MQRLGRYEVLGEIARGGMGLVLRARDPVAGREVAIKLLHGVKHGHARKRFEREAEALARVDHPHVVRLLEVGATEAGDPFLVMELVEGESLQARLAAGPLPPLEAVEWARQLCDAVAACHRVGVLHRDLKPDNVLITPGGFLALTDFGLARDTELSMSRSQLTQEGRFLGTPHYWAPEQARGDLQRIDARTDVHGIGATLFAMLTGRPPHEGDELMSLLDDLQRPKPAPSSLRPGVPAWLDRVVGRALAADPDRRYPSVEALAQALQAKDAGGSGRRAGLVGAAALGMALLGGAALAGWRAGPTPSAPAPVGSAPSRSASEELERFARYRGLHRRGAYDEAQAALAPLRHEPPRTSIEHLAHAAWRYDHDEDATADVVRALELEPDLVPALLLRSKLLRHAGSLEEAARICTRLVELEADSVEVLSETALVLSDQDQVPAAEAVLRKARQLARPEEVPLLDCIEALVRLAGHDAARAFEAIERARAAWPHSADVWWLRAKVQASLGRHDAALGSAERAAMLWPDAGGYQRLASLYADLKLVDPAIKALRRAVELEPERGEAWLELGQVLWEQGDADALPALERAVALRPSYESYMGRGVARAGRPELAELAAEDLTQALRIRPQASRPRLALAMLRLEAGAYAAADALLNEALESRETPLSASDRALGHACRALTRFELDDPQGAAEDLARVESREGFTDTLLEALAHVEQELGAR